MRINRNRWLKRVMGLEDKIHNILEHGKRRRNQRKGVVGLDYISKELL
jgi:hypothetical protein